MKNKIIKIIAMLLCLTAVVSFVTSCRDNKKSSSNTSYVKSITFDFVPCDEIGVMKMKTNLPVGTLLTFRFINGPKKCDLTVDGDVQLIGNEKYIISKPAKDKDGNYLSDGTYTVTVTTKYATEQPQKVQEELGTKGEGLTGGHVYGTNGQRIAKILKVFAVKDGKFTDSVDSENKNEK